MAQNKRQDTLATTKIKQTMAYVFCPWLRHTYYCTAFAAFLPPVENVKLHKFVCIFLFHEKLNNDYRLTATV